MKKSILCVALLVTVGALSAWGFVPPTAEQIQGAASDPEKIGALIQGASTDEAVDVLVAVIGEVEKMDIPLEAKQQVVEQLFASVQTELKETALLVLAMTAERVNPELLPVVAVVGEQAAPPPIPPVAERYLGQ